MTSNYNPGVHRFAKFVVAWTILLFVAGALVTSNDAALSVPDWPKSFGTWFPSLGMLAGGAFFEHSHRVIAGGLGIFTLVLAILIWIKDNRRWLRWFGCHRGSGYRGAGGAGRRSGEAASALLAAGDPRVLRADCVWRSAGDCGVHQSLVGHRASADSPIAGSPSIHAVATVNAEMIFLPGCAGRGFPASGTSLWPHIAGAFLVMGMVIWTAIALRKRFRSIAGAFEGADSAARDIWHSVSAGSRGVLVTDCHRRCGAAHAGHGVADGDPYRCGSATVCVFGVHRVDLLPDRSAWQGSGGSGAAPGDRLVSTVRTTELALSSRANAYIALTKPDVSLLVLMTTAAGYYMGARGPVNWLNMVQTVFATMLIAAGTAALNHYIERESDRYYAAHGFAPTAQRCTAAREALRFRSGVERRGCARFVRYGGIAGCRAWAWRRA